LLHLSYLSQVTFQDVQSVFLCLAQSFQVNVREKHFERIGHVTELSAIATHLVEDCLLHFRMGRLTQVHIDQAELPTPLNEGEGVDGLPELFWRQ
jgi:hypothetical protein